MARTLDQLAIIANQIKDATLQGENTADRVGGLLVDLIDFLRTINVDEIALSPLLTALNESGLVDPQDGQILKFKSSEDNWVFSSDITQITNTIRTILDTLGHLDNGFVKKAGDIMTGLLTTLAGIKVRNFLQLGDRFVSGLLGEGAIFRENAGGRTYLEADEMYIRVKAYFDTVEIRKFLHSGGNRIASLSGAKCVRVEMLDSNNEVVTQNPAKYRCYFRASDGDDTITNDFVVGDQAYCHVTNATNSSLSMRHYWRLVIGRNELPNENGEHWIDLSNQESETIDGIVYSGYLNISDAPAAQDDIIQLGNVNDSTRRGAIIEFVSGNDAPAYQIFQDLGSIGLATTIAQKHDAQYSYNGKNYISLGYNSSTGRAFMNVYGDFLFGDPEGSTYVKYNAFTKQLDIKAIVRFISPTTHQETTLDTFASVVTGGLENLQRQIDGEIDTWFYNGTPGPSVLPESEWVAIDIQAGNNNERLKHLGDLYYDNSTGYAYRYTNTGSEASPVFTWSQISDSAVIKALEDAAKAQDTADHKRRVFVTSAGVLPTPPYSEGDIWMNVTYPANATATDAANNIYYNDILRCKVPATYNQQGELVREGVESGETALITHWQLSSKYTDDSKFNYFFTNTYSPFVTNIQQQVDRKAETWRQDDDPSLTQGWVPSEHVGDLWMDTNDNDQYGHKTFIYVDHGEGTNPRYSWEPQAVPDEVFDKIDGKAEIFVQKPTTYCERDMWIIESGLASTDMPSGCQSGDIVVADNMPSGVTKRENSYVKGDWRKKDRYTDDTKVNSFISELLNGASDTEAVMTTAFKAIRAAMNEGETNVYGGLILTNDIELRDTAPTPSVRAGISGMYDSMAQGGGVAIWAGGARGDWEAYFNSLTPAQQAQATITSAYAKSVDRFDGSGYRAGGNLSWNANGDVTVKGHVVTATTKIDTPAIFLNGTDITDKLNALFDMFEFDTTTQSGTILIKANYSLYSLGDISALGAAAGGGGGGGGGASVLWELNDVLANSGNTGVLDAQAGYVLTCVTNGAGLAWKAAPVATTLAGLTDTSISSPANGQALIYNSTSGKWENGAISGGVQSDWNEASQSSLAYILNKPIVVRAGAFDTETYSSLAGFQSKLASMPSFIGSSYSQDWGGWEHVISNRHRNGESDGDKYGIYIRKQFNSGHLIWAEQVNGSWGSEYTIIDSGNIGSQSVNYATSAGSVESASYFSPYVTNGENDLDCLQSAFSIVPKSQATAVRLQHGSHSMAFGWFLSDYAYEHAYGGWFISDYGIPSFVGVEDGTWWHTSFITSRNIGSQSVSYATSAGSANYLNGNYSKGASTWNWNIFGLTQYWVWGQKFQDDNIGSDSGDIRFYLTPLSDSGGVGLGMNIDGPIATLSSIYAGNTIYSEGDITCNGGDVTINEPASGGAAAIWFKSEGTTKGNLRVKANGELYFYTGTGAETTAGCINAGELYSYGDVTAASDERAKDVISNVVLDINDIANAPAIRFTWKDKRDDLQHVGSIAQYWQKILPESVSDRNDVLGLNYGAASMVGLISVAKEVVSQGKHSKQQDEQIKELERQLNKANEKIISLENKVKRLKTA